MPNTLKIFTDGGSRGNPGPAASAFVVLDTQDNLVIQRGFYLGISTNNQAEYFGVIKSLTWLQNNFPLQTSFIKYFLDSLLVVQQLSGIYKIKDLKLIPLYNQIKTLENNLISLNRELLTISYTHIPRSQNYRADELVNRTLDNQLVS